MGLPILNEIWSGIRWILDFFINKSPASVKIIFFLLMLLVFSAMIPFMLHLFGIHCTFEGEIVTTSPLSVITNVKLGLLDANEVYNRSSYVPDTIGLDVPVAELLPEESCRVEVCHVTGMPSDIWTYSATADCDNETTRWVFKDKDWDWSRCIICDGDSNFTVIEGNIASESGYYCFGDAYPIPDDEKSWFQGWVCNPDQRCVPPKNYYFESDTGTFDCIDDYSCGQNLTGDDIIPLINQELENVDAELLYTETDGIDDRSAIMFACTDNNKPQITFFGIPIFDYRTWLILIVIYSMFIFLRNIRRH